VCDPPVGEGGPYDGLPKKGIASILPRTISKNVKRKRIWNVPNLIEKQKVQGTCGERKLCEKGQAISEEA